eukprot:TRINITY_DN69169_c0_g1_i1.p3 TRINITY_DN69169_c0_g1~~TRINITY_DN69169_c0_g1_i1.p3  ORF type:complete len:105 (-),score=4.39 TRINITY_DN69169_c0_g1_i1:328-642(-)
MIPLPESPYDVDDSIPDYNVSLLSASGARLVSGILLCVICVSLLYSVLVSILSLRYPGLLLAVRRHPLSPSVVVSAGRVKAERRSFVQSFVQSAPVTVSARQPV